MVVHPNDALNKGMARYPLGSVEWLADGKVRECVPGRMLVLENSLHGSLRFELRWLR